MTRYSTICPHRGTTVLVAAMLGLSAPASAESSDVGPNTSAEYVKECGACHFPYQPGFLPVRSWRRVMAGLGEHFGDNAELKAGERESITAYLVAGAADFAANARSREVMATLRPDEAPLRVTGVLYVGGIHGGFLDPKFLGTPRVKTLADCAACHPRAAEGRFLPRNYVVSDELFRVLSGD
jgi:hypothetical protein